MGHGKTNVGQASDSVLSSLCAFWSLVLTTESPGQTYTLSNFCRDSQAGWPDSLSVGELKPEQLKQAVPYYLQLVFCGYQKMMIQRSLGERIKRPKV